MMTAMHCTHCDSENLMPGFIEDSGDSSRGHARWVEGPLEIGYWGAIRTGRAHWLVDAYRCADCFHLELFTRTKDEVGSERPRRPRAR